MRKSLSEARIGSVRAQLEALQEEICQALEREDGGAFRRDELDRTGGGLSRPRVLEDGRVLERAAVNLSHTVGPALPPAATARRPELADCAYQAVSVSLIVHPRNPYVPTCHANFRFFEAGGGGPGGGEVGASGAGGGHEPIWWFGGGFDLTPCYGFEEDCVHWHRTARDALAPFGAELYPRFKQACDEYFHLPHRGEPRGIGGIFYDDFDEGGFERCFALQRRLGEAWLAAYLPILRRRKEAPFGEREREFQLYRRGRYVEFNLLYDRGTRFGLQAGGPAESILASLPPLVRWRYDWSPEPGSAEARLREEFLRPRDWLAGAAERGGSPGRDREDC